MENTGSKYMGLGKQHRKVALMEAVEQFINRGSSVQFLKPNSTEPLSAAIISDIEAADKIYKAYPSSNVAAIVGPENNLVAIKLEQESPFEPDPFEMLAELEQMHGPLPSTMTINYPNGSQCRLFDYPEEGKVCKSSLESSVKLLYSNMYGTGLVVLEPSLLRDGGVTTLNHETRISQLPEKWVEFICTDSSGNYNKQVPEEIVTSVSEPADDQISTPSEVELESDGGHRPGAVSSEESTSELMTQITPDDFLKMEIARMVADNTEPDVTVANAKQICSQYGLMIDGNKLAYEVFAEYRNVGAGGRYFMIGEDEALARFIGEVELEAFKDDTQTLRCRIKDTGEIVGLASNAKPGNRVVDLITRKFLLMTNSVPKLQPLKDALRVLESNARFSSGEVKLYNRVGKHHGVVYYDMGDNTAIRITEHGWEQVTAPAIFKRAPNIKSQVQPTRNGNFEQFFEFVNCEPKDRLLLAAYMVSTILPDISHPIAYVYGDHGSAKSSLTDKIKMVCDPSPDACYRLALNNQRKELVRNLSQYHLPVYDNVSIITDDASNVFCMASTGGGSDDRRLYTDEDSVIKAFKCCPIMSSVKMCIKKPDLLDRALLFRLKRLKQHKPDEIIDLEFQAALPGILGGMFNILAEAIRSYPTVQIEENFRMADFAKWGYAIAQAMGNKGEQFLNDYQENYLARNEHVAQGNTLCGAVLGLMANRTEYEAEIGVAYSALKKQCSVDKYDKTFPSISRELRPYLEEHGPVLASFNIAVEFGKRTNKGWPVRFTKFTPVQTENTLKLADSQEKPELLVG